MNKKGFMLVGLLVFASIAILLIGFTINAAISNIKLSQRLYDRERAFHIAEAGNEYYRWHLAHASMDFKDGTNTAGPYSHDMFDIQGSKIGAFALTITPPVVGSTIVKVKSQGTVLTSSTTRKIQTTLAVASLAKYAVAANDVMRFGAGTEVFGPLHSNNGIRFDGVAHNIITSSLSSYDDPDHSGAVEFGVHTHVLPPPTGGTSNNFVSAEAPPSTSTVRTDVFMAGRQFPVPAFDFGGMTTDLSAMKAAASSSTGKYFAPSGAGFLGYHIVFKVSGASTTFDMYKITSLYPVSGQCSYYSNTPATAGWGSWSIYTGNFVGNYPIPANGVIFVEDNVWVDGVVKNARVTVAAGKFPDVGTRPSIIVNSDLLYTYTDGRDVVALVAQGNVNVGLMSQDNLTIDAALVAQNGRVGRYYYDYTCGPQYIRNSLTLLGMIATNIRYGFSYTDGTGYINRNLNYDGNLLYGPPPSFPLTSSQYSTVSWEELK